jgi:hypothetical protein
MLLAMQDPAQLRAAEAPDRVHENRAALMTRFGIVNAQNVVRCVRSWESVEYPPCQ